MYRKLLIILVVLAVTFSSAFAAEPKVREFEFTYAFNITDVDSDAKEIKFWVPIPQDTRYQKIMDIQTEVPMADFSVNIEDVYRNKMLFGKSSKKAAIKKPIKVTFKVKRTEMIGMAANKKEDEDNAKFLQANSLVTLSDRIKKISADVTKGKVGTMDKARAIYDYVFAKMSYDKSGEGWGRGDTEYACDVEKGNCTDFHSLFISLARAAGIPARFKIGFPLPPDKESGQISGYHCWAEFYDEEHGWVPVDASEAKKNPKKKEYYFTNVCENRVEFTVGRDLTLNPPQSGDKLNFMIYPYIEVDGKPHFSYEKHFSFKNI